MKNKINKILFSIYLVLSANFILSCMEDINEPTEVGFYSSGDLITYFETHGDFINSKENPALVSAEQVYGSVDQSFLLDIRSASEYASGHIEGALNVNISELIDTLKNKDLNKFLRIVIISTTGQKAAYTVSLLRLYGFTNIYSLDYGMGQWNELFSDVWINARDDSEYVWSFTTNYYSKPPLSNKLPALSFENPEMSTESLIQSRIKLHLTDEAYYRSTGTVAEIDGDFALRYQKFTSIALICYSAPDLYDIKRYFKDASPPVTWGGHFRSIPYYDPSYDFKASTKLLTLPIDKPIYIYSYNGQRSQYIVAYLRLLGYDARSVLFGAISMLY
ncbi:MAG: rhodanese-like domain-containing protein, partial [Melioribacteraceae bacterium]|nr:rhodanese-like domain-containing protein [Melioribacteraceae bacterium]